MLVLESASVAYGLELLGGRKKFGEDRCGGGAVEQALILYNSYITASQQIFHKRIFSMNYKLSEVRLGG